MEKPQDLVCGSVEAACDWVTWTVPVKGWDKHHGNDLFYSLLKEPDIAQGYPKEQGFQGFKGEGTEHLFIGERDKWMMLRASGMTADTIAEKLLTHDFPGRATRLDFQVTADYGKYQKGQADQWRETVNAWETEARPRARKAKAIFDHASGPNALTIGKRDSDRYLRIYRPVLKHGDKYPPGAWRFELECKGPLARGAWEQLQQQRDTARVAMSGVTHHCMELGLYEWWMETTKATKIKGVYENTNEEKKFKWLTTTAQPVIMRLADVPGFGVRLELWLEAMLAEIKNRRVSKP